MREEEVGEKLGQTLKNIFIPDDVLAQLERSLLADTGHQERSQKLQRERLEQRLGFVRHRFEQAYMDKLDSKVSEEFWKRKWAQATGGCEVRSLGLIVGLKRRFEVRKRHQTSHLDLTMLGFEPEGREFESLRARHSLFLAFSKIRSNGFL